MAAKILTGRHLCTVDEAMALMRLEGTAAAAFRRLLEREEPGAWFVVASKLARLQRAS